MWGEPAVDTGGVLLHQPFTDVFGEIASGGSYLHLFRDSNQRLTPIYRSEHVLNGVFEVLGKIIAHSLIQGGPVFPFFAPGYIGMWQQEICLKLSQELHVFI